MASTSLNPGPTADVVRAWRLAAGLTVPQAAEMVHVARNTWERWEINPDLPSARRMPKAIFELFFIKIKMQIDAKKRPKRP